VDQNHCNVEVRLMKIFIVILLLFLGVPVKAQNPDGRSASLHITPSWVWGSANYFRNIPLGSSQTMVTLPASSVSNDTGVINYPSAFGIDVMLKVPTTSSITLSLSYSFHQQFEEVPEYVHYWGLNGKIHKVSFTASVYNLFSVY
jgi:hypothetical protein